MIIWLVSFILFVLIEVITVNLVTIWFAIGSLGAALTSCFTDNLTIQTLVFAVVSAITLFCFRPLINKVAIKKTATNVDSLINKTGTITKEINEDQFGEVKIEQRVWTAISKNRNIIEGTKVKVIGIDGIKLIVEEV